MRAVLAEDIVPIIQDDYPLIADVFKHLDTPQLALIVRRSVPAVRGDGDVRIYHVRAHFESIRLRRDALPMAAISPISSPKK